MTRAVRREPREAVPQFGLVCITASETVRFRSMTRTRLRSLAPREQRAALDRLYRENLGRFRAAIDFCAGRRLPLYRIPSNLFPFADTPLGAARLRRLRPLIGAEGRRATALGIRLVAHPDQYVVLNSDDPTVIANSISILELHGRLMDDLFQPRSSWAAIQIHGGKSDRAALLVRTIKRLEPKIRNRLALENDERAYGAQAILEICRQTGCPMVFDAHHHLVHERLRSYHDPTLATMLAAARSTWPNPEWQLTHLSNGANSLHDPRHSDFISVVPRSFSRVPWVEVEAKRKEVAIETLRQHWRSLKAA